ncbi:MAG: hypothetical protein HYZ53_05090 [Planctomycetes bacterium]|nr:hypothetical protein [Planctomycetota bacterium]
MTTRTVLATLAFAVVAFLLRSAYTDPPVENPPAEPPPAAAPPIAPPAAEPAPVPAPAAEPVPAAAPAPIPAAAPAPGPAVRPATVVPLRPNRSYDGAPPVIPHTVTALAAEDCLECHGDKEVGAPRSPHADLQRCLQCHLPQPGTGQFKETSFAPSTYPIGLRGHSYGPWLIPHPLTMRENCLPCHSGEKTSEALRTTHPERTRCVQCHVPANERWPGPRRDVQLSPLK